MREKNIKKHTKKLNNKYYPKPSESYSENIYQTINYINNNKHKKKKLKKFIRKILKDIDESYLVESIKQFDKKLFHKHPFISIDSLNNKSEKEQTEDIKIQTETEELIETLLKNIYN